MASAGKTPMPILSGPMLGRVKAPARALEAHLALVLAAITVGRSVISGIDARADIRATIAALRTFGCRIESRADGSWSIDGVGLGGLAEPDCILEIGQAGLGIPLLIALAAMQPVTAIFGDRDSRCPHSWHWLAAALEASGAGFVGRAGALLPLTVLGSSNPLPAEFDAGSALERVALLLAALHCPGESVVRHRFLEQDGTDSIFAAYGARLARDPASGESAVTRIQGETELWPATLTLPGDTAMVVLLAAAAISRPDSAIVIEGIVPDARFARARAWFTAFGADLATVGVEARGGTIIIDLRITGGALSGAVIGPDDTTMDIDDYPLLAALAARATGRSVLAGWERRPEWLAPLARGLRRCGVDAEVAAMSLVINGTGGGPIAGGCKIEEPLDHRVAAAFLILGLSATAPVVLDHGAALLEQYPSLAGLLSELSGSRTVTDP